MSLRLPDPMSLPLTVSERREAGAKGCLLCSPGDSASLGLGVRREGQVHH